LAHDNRRWIAGVAALVAVVIAGLAWWQLRGRGQEPASRAGSAPVANTPAHAPTAPRPSLPGDGARTAEPMRLVSATVEQIGAESIGGFEGRVVDFGTGEGVEGADIAFELDGATTTVTSEQDGVFRWDPAEPGSYAIATVTADGYLPFAPELGTSPIQLTARRGLRVRGVTVYLSPAIDYTGTVVNPEGEPVEGATVEMVNAATGTRTLAPLQATFTSGSDGTFVFHAPDNSVLVAKHSDYGEGTAVLDGPAQITHELRIELAPKGAKLTAEHNRFDSMGGARASDENSAMVRGRVVDSGGDAVPAFSVVLLVRMGAMTSVPVERRVVFDAEGEFVIDGVTPGDYEIVAAAYGFAQSKPVEVTAAEPASARPVEVKLSRGGIVFGTVLDRETGAPLAKARVVAEGAIGGDSPDALPTIATVVTDDGGEFELAGMMPGRQSIRVHAFQHDSRIISQLEVVEGERIGPLSIDLAPTREGEEPKLELAGIGVEIAAGEDGLLIRRVLPDGGAAEAGLASGDIILGVGSRPVTELGFDESLQHIRGPEGTTVHLTIRKAGDSGTIELNVYRRRIRA
jgi:protocatechuate 3,4-dioxygenase beta subunit